METPESKPAPTAAPTPKPLAYRNGRTPHAGDTVVNLQTGQSGVLRDLKPEQATSNARLGPIREQGLAKPDPKRDPVVNISDCVHLQDVQAAFAAKK